jgi:DNA-binding SARP family transcriptional activator
VDFQILGAMRVLGDDGAEVRIPAGRERSLLALLLVERGRVVTVDRIVDALWGAAPPGTAAKAVQGYVSHLRRIVPGAIVTRGRGYALEAPDDAVDAARFERLAADGRHRLDEDDAAGAATALDEALRMWRGPALADAAYDEFAQDEIRRLEEGRLAAREDRAEALLRTGRSAGLAAELDGLVAVHPLRERLRSLAMLAMYRDGRQADALDLYERGRRTLAAELGVDPGPELARAHRAILNQDPALGGPAREAPAAPPHGAPPIPDPRVRRRRTFVLVGAAVALVVAAVAALALTRDSGDGGIAVRLPAVVVIDPATDEVVASVATGSDPISVAADDRGAWVGDARDGTVTLVDGVTRAVVRRAGIGAPAVDLAVGAGSLWAATGGFGEVLQIDPSLAAVTRRIPLGAPGAVEATTVSAVAADEGTVWAGAQGGLVRIDPATGEPGATTDLGDASALQIAVSGETVWATTFRRRAKRVERASGRVTAEFYAGAFIVPVALDGERSAWIGDGDEGRLWRIDAETGATQLTARAGRGSNGIAVSAGSVWVASWPDGTIQRVDPDTGEVRAVIPVGGAPADIAVGGGLVWVAVPEGQGEEGATTAAGS